MTYTQMIELLPNENSPVEPAGRGFFSAQTSASDRKRVLEFLLDECRYEQILKLIYCGHINGHVNMQNSSADYVAVTSGTTNINTRYFSLFMQLAENCGISEGRLVPFMYCAATAKKQSELRAWQVSAVRFLTKLAKADYDSAWKYLTVNDPDFKLASIMLSVDKERALKGLTELAVFGKGVNKVALRNFLRGYKHEVFEIVRPMYGSLKNDGKVAATRLLLSFKNSSEVLDFLHELHGTEKSKSVLSLIESSMSASRKPKENDGKKVAENVLYDAMVHGTSVSCEKFRSEWLVAPYLKIAESLFFSVYENGFMRGIAIVDEGKVLDLDNRPYDIPNGCEIKVLHPVELNSSTEYLRRLDIEQPFNQIKRKAYFPSADDKRSNGCFGVSGTVLGAGKFKAGMKKYGFKPLNRNSDGFCSQVGLARDGILCVLGIAPLDFSAVSDDYSVQAQGVRFYAEKDVIRLGGQRFVDGVAPFPVSKIDARAFSEFMYAVYELMGCQ